MSGLRNWAVRSLRTATALGVLLGLYSLAAAEANYDTAWTYI